MRRLSNDGVEFLGCGSNALHSNDLIYCTCETVFDMVKRIHLKMNMSTVLIS